MDRFVASLLAMTVKEPLAMALPRHCERSEAIQRVKNAHRPWIATDLTALAMTVSAFSTRYHCR